MIGLNLQNPNQSTIFKFKTDIHFLCWLKHIQSNGVVKPINMNKCKYRGAEWKKVEQGRENKVHTLLLK